MRLAILCLIWLFVFNAQGGTLTVNKFGKHTLTPFKTNGDSDIDACIKNANKLITYGQRDLRKHFTFLNKAYQNQTIHFYKHLDDAGEIVFDESTLKNLARVDNLSDEEARKNYEKLIVAAFSLGVAVDRACPQLLEHGFDCKSYDQSVFEILQSKSKTIKDEDFKYLWYFMRDYSAPSLPAYRSALQSHFSVLDGNILEARFSIKLHKSMKTFGSRQNLAHRIKQSIEQAWQGSFVIEGKSWTFRTKLDISQLEDDRSTSHSLTLALTKDPTYLAKVQPEDPTTILVNQILNELTLSTEGFEKTMVHEMSHVFAFPESYFGFIDPNTCEFGFHNGVYPNSNDYNDSAANTIPSSYFEALYIQYVRPENRTSAMKILNTLYANEWGQ